MLLTQAFYPLQGFLNQADYNTVLNTLRLTSGTLWPLPITLDVSHVFSHTISIGSKIELRDAEGVLLAIMNIESIWAPDKRLEAQFIFGTNDSTHPAVDYLLHYSEPIYLGGKLEKVELPTHYDYRDIRHTPATLKAEFEKRDWQRIVAYHTHQPMHRQEQHETFHTARKVGANLLIHAAVSDCPNNSFDHFLRIRCYLHLLKEYPQHSSFFSLLNLNIYGAGIRETLCHALLSKNYGCTHFMVANEDDKRRMTPFQSTFLQVKHYEEEMGIKIVNQEKYIYVQEHANYIPLKKVSPQETILTLSHQSFLHHLYAEKSIPDWFTYPAILKEIRNAYPPPYEQGFTVFFTGLSGSGKSTIANALRIKLLEKEERPVTLLDGDIVRKNLSSELSFSKEHRNLNILRIAFVANEITKNGGIAICAPIAPYQTIRQQVRKTIEAIGGYIEVHVSTPIEECERRDRKGLYAKARAGLIEHFTGVNDPYERPENPDLRLDTTDISADACADQVLLLLKNLGFLKS
jgi:sulfate adenylyltransferase